MSLKNARRTSMASRAACRAPCGSATTSAIAHDAGQIARVVQPENQLLGVRRIRVVIRAAIELFRSEHVLAGPGCALPYTMFAIRFVEHVGAHFRAIEPVALAAPDVEDRQVIGHVRDRRVGVVTQANAAGGVEVHTQKRCVAGGSQRPFASVRTTLVVYSTMLRGRTSPERNLMFLLIRPFPLAWHAPCCLRAPANAAGGRSSLRAGRCAARRSASGAREPRERASCRSRP